MMLDQETKRGQALILIVLGIVGLVALVALAIDAGNAFSDRRKAQNAADTAVLAAALAKVRSQDLNDAALTRATSNGYTNGINGTTVVVNNPPGAGCNGINGPYAGNSEYIQVIIHSTVDTFFGPVVNINQLHNCVEAIARASNSAGGGGAGPNALMSLNPTKSQAVSGTGSSQINISGGDLFVNSNRSNAISLTGSARITLTGGGNTYVVGNVKYSGSSEITPPPITGVAPQSDPLASLVPPEKPAGTCTKIDLGGSSVLTISPGCYSKIKTSGSAKITLTSGYYYIDGDGLLNTGSGRITGDNVFIYVKNGKVSSTGSGYFQLTAQTSGVWAGMLIYMDRLNADEVVLTGSSQLSMVGTIYAPASNVELTGSGETTAIHSQIISDTVSLTGSSQINLVYIPSENYNPGSPVIELTK